MVVHTLMIIYGKHCSMRHLGIPSNLETEGTKLSFIWLLVQMALKSFTQGRTTRLDMNPSIKLSLSIKN